MEETINPMQSKKHRNCRWRWMYDCLPHNFTSNNDEYNKLDPLTWQTYIRGTFYKQSNESKSPCSEYFKCLRINWMVQSFQLHEGSDSKKKKKTTESNECPWFQWLPLLLSFRFLSFFWHSLNAVFVLHVFCMIL